MATTTDVLVTKMVMDSNAYAKGARQVESDSLKVAKATDSAKRGANSIGDAFHKTYQGIKQGTTIALGFAAAMTAVALGVGAASFALMSRAAEFDALVAAMTAVEGSATRVKKALSDLREIARGPGLGFREAIEGYTGLRRAGLGMDFSERLIRELGNQVALGGGGKAELGRVLRAVSQIATKPFLQGEELLQLTEAGIPAYKMVKDAFGTSDTEELKRQGIGSTQVLTTLLTAMEKTKRVAGGAKNEFENLSDALDIAGVAAGRALNESLLPYVSQFTAAIEGLESSGTITAVFQGIAENIKGIFDAFSLDNLEGALIEVGALMETIAGGIRNFALNIKGLAELLGIVIENSLLGQMTKGFNIMDEFERNKRTLEMQMAAGKTLREIAAKRKGEETTPPAENPMAPLIDTARNTADIAKNTKQLLDLRKYAFGGGDVGRLGVTPVEMAGGGGKRIQINAPKGPHMIMDPHAYISDVIGQYERARGR